MEEPITNIDVLGSCEHCGETLMGQMDVDEDAAVDCPNCGKKSHNWDESPSTSSGEKIRYQIHQIKSALDKGLITYEEAKEQAQPIIDIMNTEGKSIAKAHGMKYKPVSFISLMR